MFKNRIDAALQLAKKLKQYKNADGVVLAIPRGGVVLGKVIADKLGLPLEVMLSKKISHPLHKEFAIGAVSLESRILNDTAEVPEIYIEKETERLRELLRQRYQNYYRDRKHLSLTDKIVIVIDDGIATGFTVLSILELVSKHRPKKIVLAVPVTSVNAKKMLESASQVAEVVCILAPEDFYSVGQYYQDFQQVTDEEVVELLKVTGGEKAET